MQDSMLLPSDFCKDYVVDIVTADLPTLQIRL